MGCYFSLLGARGLFSFTGNPWAAPPAALPPLLGTHGLLFFAGNPWTYLIFWEPPWVALPWRNPFPRSAEACDVETGAVLQVFPIMAAVMGARTRLIYRLPHQNIY